VVTRLEALKIGCGPINTLKEVFADPQIKARNVVREMEHSSGATVKVIANPVRLSKDAGRLSAAAPLLGEHTVEILRDRLGLTETELATLGQQKVI